MRYSGKIISAFVTITLGVLLIAWRGDIIHVLMTVLGISLIVLGVLDLLEKNIRQAWIKLALGVLSVAFGWLLVSAVAYVVAIATIAFAVWLTVGFFKGGTKICFNLSSVVQWLKPVLLVITGLFLFFNNGGKAEWAFILVGICIVLLGGVLLADAFIND